MFSEIADHFNGDFGAVLTPIFPKHRFGVEGLVLDSVVEKVATDDESDGVMYSVKLSDEVLRLLWLATALANAVGKRASLRDALAAPDARRALDWQTLTPWIDTRA